MTDTPLMDINEVMRYLPHRFPMLMVDRVLECKPNESLTAIKNVTINEPFFPGHFPGRPVFPGVFILEALAQACGILAFASAGEVPDKDSSLYFVGIDKARFRRPVEPGDQLILKVGFQKVRRGIYRFDTRAEVDGKAVCTAELMVSPNGAIKP